MTQGNVIVAPMRRPLRLFPFQCSILSLSTMSVAERAIRNTTMRAGKARTELDARRAALMAAAQAGDRVAYETLLRDCVSLIVSIARRQGGQHVEGHDVEGSNVKGRHDEVVRWRWPAPGHSRPGARFSQWAFASREPTMSTRRLQDRRRRNDVLVMR